MEAPFFVNEYGFKIAVSGGVVPKARLGVAKKLHTEAGPRTIHSLFGEAQMAQPYFPLPGPDTRPLILSIGQAWEHT